MKRVTLLTLGLIFTWFSSFSQDDKDTAWKTRGDASLMFSQSSFTNWSAGGENMITLNGFINLYAGYEKGKSKWENLLGLAYGFNKTGTKEMRKSEDKIDFLSTYGLKAAEKWYYSANFSLKSQFAKGYNYHEDTIPKVIISDFMAPGYISLGAGMEYRPYDFMSFYLSPMTARWIIVNDQALADAGAFGVEAAEYGLDSLGMPDYNMKIKDGKIVKNEFGAYFRFIFIKDIVKNVNLNTKLELFSNYLENPHNVDVNWDTMIGMKINEWLSASVGIQVLYDHDTPITDKDGITGPRTQIKQLFSAGLSYKFSK